MQPAPPNRKRQHRERANCCQLLPCATCTVAIYPTPGHLTHRKCDSYLCTYVLRFLIPSQGKVKISELQVNPEYEQLLPPLSKEDLKNLEESILKERVLHPFIINPKKVILDGHHRLRICQRHSIPDVPFIERSFPTPLAEKEFVVSFNLDRRHLTSTQKIELAIELLKIEMVKTNQRRIAQLKQFREEKTVTLTSAERDEEQGEAIEIVAKKVGLGKDTLKKGQQILEAAKTDKKFYEAWQDLSHGTGSITINSVYQELQAKEEAARVIANANVEGVFQVVVVDPPGFKLESLKRMSIPFDEKGCVLWLWTPLTSFCDAFSLILHWGFQLQTILTWVKNKKRPGEWLFNQTEHCLLATKGTPRHSLTFQATVLIATSSPYNPKPDDFFFLASSLTPGARKLSVFYHLHDWHGPL